MLRLRKFSILGLAITLIATALAHPALAVDKPAALASKYSGTGPIKAVATVGMVADAVQRVGGSHVTVQTIIRSGGDPHLYKASPQDVMMLTSADIVFYNGLMLEGKMADILSKYSTKKAAVPVGQAIPTQYLLRSGDVAGTYDPHIWMDVGLWQRVVQGIADSLSEFDAAHADDYKANGNQFIAQLSALEQYVKTVTQSVPKDQRILITAHDAFNYFGRAYGFEVRGIQGVSTESEAGLKDINNLVDLIVEKQIKAIFFETSVAQKNIQALIEGTRAKGWELAVGGNLYSDAMGADGTKEGTYLGMIEHNVNTIVKALGGLTPKNGFVSLDDIRGR